MAEVEKLKPYSDDGRSKDRQVASMFDAIAPAYDFMNTAMSLGMHRRWQRRLVDAAAEGSPKVVVDLATGTGAVALALKKRLPQATVTGIDLSEGMLAQARRKKGAEDIEFRCADALATGLPDAMADAVTIAYGVRNYADIAAGIGEMARILKPGGRLCILELSEPRSFPMKQLYRAYSRTLIPLAGRLVSGDCSAYSYLPRSIAACPQRSAMTEIIRDAGFASATYRSLCAGVCTLYTATR